MPIHVNYYCYYYLLYIVAAAEWYHSDLSLQIDVFFHVMVSQVRP